MPGHWFSADSFDELLVYAPEELAKQDPDARPALLVRDRGYIQRLMQRIESIDPQGDMMKKPGPNTEVLQLAFCTSGQPPEGIEFFNGRIKTPSTAFHSSGPPESTKIYEELHGLLSPDLNMVLPIVVDTPLVFPDFTILARALRVHDQGPGPRHTGGGQTRTFELSWDDHSLLIEVYSGQTPPAPQEFTVRDTTYRLLTYQTPDGERLFPNHFLIVAVA